MSKKQNKQQRTSKKPAPQYLTQEQEAKQPQFPGQAQQNFSKRWSLIVLILLVLLAILWIIASIFNAPTIIYNTFYAFFAVLGVILAWLQLTSPLSSSKQTNNGTKKDKELLRTRLWQNRKVRAGTIVVILLLILGALGTASILHCAKVPNLTPQKTLTLFCSALKQQDYQTAYSLLADSEKQKITENYWSARMAESNLGLVSYCTVSNTSDDGSLGTSTITYRTPDGLDYIATYRLRNECGEWKIFDVSYS